MALAHLLTASLSKSSASAFVRLVSCVWISGTHLKVKSIAGLSSL
jgi:hypothetical protein